MLAFVFKETNKSMVTKLEARQIIRISSGFLPVSKAFSILWHFLQWICFVYMIWKINKVIKDNPCQCLSTLSDVSQEAYMRGMIPELDVKTLLGLEDI